MHLVVVVLFAELALGDCIRCYVCNSKQDSRCLDPFTGNATSLETVDCDHDNNVRAALETVANLMTKLGQAPARDMTDVLATGPKQEAANIPASCQKIDLTVLGEKVIGRGCSVHQLDSFNPCDAVKLVVTAEVALNSCGVCLTDGCNVAVNVSSGTLPLLMLVGLEMFHRGIL